LFIAGTQPQAALPKDTCGIDVVVAVNVEDGHDAWLKADRDWLRRAERGAGVAGGPDRTRTAYFYNGAYRPFGSSWGVLVGGKCGPQPSPTCFVTPTPDPSGVVPSFAIPTPEGSAVAALPCPPAPPSETPSVAPSEVPSEPPPTEQPTATPKPPKDTPPPPPTATPPPPVETPTPAPPAP
jgi:hypothetical protein